MSPPPLGTVQIEVVYSGIPAVPAALTDDLPLTRVYSLEMELLTAGYAHLEEAPEANAVYGQSLIDTAFKSLGFFIQAEQENQEKPGE